jgi:DNA-binding NarL/FixJ family response regulator
MKVLIVDDSAKILRSLSRALSGMADVEVVGKAQDVAQALQLTDELRPDVVVLDIGLREGSGFDVLRHIRQTGRSTKVILTANNPSKQHLQRGEREGADYVFDKSSEFDKVVQVVEKIALGE